MLTKLTALRKLLTETGQIDHPVVTIGDGRIVSLETGEANGSTETLTAAFFDIHVHGACSHDLAYGRQSPSEIKAWDRFLGESRVGHYLPTTVTEACRCKTLRALDTLAGAIEAGATDAMAALPVGIHLEGPFIPACWKRGVHPPSCGYSGAEVELLRAISASGARGHIRLMTVALDRRTGRN